MRRSQLHKVWPSPLPGALAGRICWGWGWGWGRSPSRESCLPHPGVGSFLSSEEGLRPPGDHGAGAGHPDTRAALAAVRLSPSSRREHPLEAEQEGARGGASWRPLSPQATGWG